MLRFRCNSRLSFFNSLYYSKLRVYSITTVNQVLGLHKLNLNDEEEALRDRSNRRSIKAWTMLYLQSQK